MNRSPNTQPADVVARAPKMRERLQKSASKFVRVGRCSVKDRSAFSVLIDAGEVEIFESALGRAYRFKVEASA